jgi:hypothetical protein
MEPKPIYTAFVPWNKDFHREADMLPDPQTFGYEHGDQVDVETMLPDMEADVNPERKRVVYGE